MSFSVVLDTCVLYGTYLNDLLLRLAESGTFRPLWSDDILDELERNLVENGAASASSARRRVSAMRRYFEDALVTGYQDLEQTLLCDPKDRHVLAAAVRAKASLLVTFNLKDFPGKSVTDFDLQVVHPDDFLRDQLSLYGGKVLKVLRQQVEDYQNPEVTFEGLLNYLERSGVPGFVEEIRECI